ncbi:tetratricopeptide repeat protein [Shewanella intestini]|uniref:Tetratricopeptide repeat protein n=1 Tax=Shewanella intestini TaxID=2017544 RepID=A0ABS5I047_9GAMM|nr:MULTISPECIES: tetratricopeptide repeat protein [Shewanella]MBR9727397.1 tetratricopeptide repeat protein [Shewanella intestini]MRG35553.1 tetratricopeptide repeat protein [Shewanella sp. XMDDZSB0408]
MKLNLPYKKLTTLLLSACLYSPVMLSAQPVSIASFEVPKFATMPVSRYEPTLNNAAHQTLKQVQDLLNKQQYQAAITELTLGLKSNNSAALWYTLASVQLQQRQTDKAKMALEKALDVHANFTRAQIVLAGIYTQEGRYNKARPLIQAAIRHESTAGLYSMLAYGYIQQQQYIPAKAAYQQALLLDGNNSTYLKGLLQVTMALNELTAAQNILTSLIEQYGMDSQLLLIRANLAQRQGNDNSAINSLRLALTQDKVANAGEIKWQLSQLYLKNDMFSNAVPLLDEIMAHQTLPEAKQLVSVLNYLLEKDQSKQVVSLVNNLNKRTQVSSKLKSQLLVVSGKAFVNQGRHQQASKAFTQAVHLDSLNGEALIEQALLLQTTHQQQAQILLSRAADISGFEVRALTLQAQMLLDTQAYQRALLLLQRAYKIAPMTPGLSANIASVSRLATLNHHQ